VAAALTTAKKFSIAYFVLAALVGGAIGTFVMLVERPAPPPPPPWSAWQPTSVDKLARAQEIGTHIAAQYHLPNGKRLVRVVVGSPAGTSSPIQAVAFATKVPAKQSDLLSVVPATGSMMYILCGDGPKCAINGGTASIGRGAVVRREALELALYTFRYVKDVTSVVTFFPPKKGDAMSFALFFDKGSFAKQLDHPLHKTLVRQPTGINLAPSERATVDLLTNTRILHFALERDSSSGQRVLVLAKKLG
jgi:hypothetical protein